MNIKIGKYRLTSSSHDFAVSEPTVSEKGKEYNNNPSYHPTLISALENVLKRKVMQSEATTLNQLVKDVQASREELQSLLGGLV